MSKTPDDTISSAVPVMDKDAVASEAVRSGEKAEAQGQELTETQKIAMEESELPHNGRSPEYVEDESEDQTGISPDRVRS